jgi:hypothetical protein
MTKENSTLQVGDKMEDGTIYAGISPDTGEKMYAAPDDAPISMDFNEAAEYAKNLEVGGKKDFRVPSKAELKVLFDNREKGSLKGTFNLTGSNRSGSYGSSTPCYTYNAYAQRFNDGAQHGYGRFQGFGASIRCVRG